MIKEIIAREILDSRGNPTVEADVITEKGLFRSAVPSGASTGAAEALELRDENKRYMGRGVQKAVSNINDFIAPKLQGRDETKQNDIDKVMIELDGTENKSKLGANAIVAVSMSVCKAGAAADGKILYEYIGMLCDNKNFILPVPQMNVMNGGRHAGLENDIQEQMFMPVKAKSFTEALRIGTEAYHTLKNILKDKYGAQGTLLGDEGGFVPKVNSINARLELMTKALEECGYENKIFIALDAAASEFYYDDTYNLYGKTYSAAELIDFYKELINTFKIVSLEDGMAENDWRGWSMLNKEIGKKTQIVGDDLLVTNTKRIREAIDKQACNALLLKLNQIGTVSEAIDAAKLSFHNKWHVIVSHRSGETEDTLIADLVVGLGSGQSKFGAPARSERNCKYNQLLRIEELGKNIKYAEF